MVKPKSFRPWNPEQTLLLLPSPVDWLPENHLVFFLLDLAGELDLEKSAPSTGSRIPTERRPAGKTPPSGFSPAISSLTTAGSAISAADTCLPHEADWFPSFFCWWPLRSSWLRDSAHHWPSLQTFGGF
jgi:hypothetical protein